MKTGLYTHDSIERLRQAVDMVELVGAKTDLRRVGSRWVGLCPFHEERTPSFSVEAEKKVYYCFGCEAGGDAIGFVRETEALDFPEAVEFLADRYGVELQRESEDPRAEERRRQRDRLRALLERTARFYATFLWESGEAAKAREYLLGRGLGEEVLREFRVGYAPSAADRVALSAQRDGFKPEELLAADVARRGRGGGLYDRFRGRITFPLADGRGRVLGFGARAMGEGRGPKYLNTAESDLFHKGRQLFGIDLARSPAAKAGRIVVVEGYTDVLALHQAGVRESVAIMGTALTDDQLRDLERAAPLVVLALDADRSGMNAMLRAVQSAGDRTELRVVEMPEGQDPADMLAQSGIEAFNARLERAVSVLEFQVRRVLADADLGTPTGRDRALEEARPLISASPARSATRDELVRIVADRLDMHPSSVSEGLGGPDPAGARSPSGSASAVLAVERAYLALCLEAGALGRKYLERLEDHHLLSEAARHARDHLLAHFDDPLADLPVDDPATAALLTGLAAEASEQDPPTEAVLQGTFLQLELRRINREIKQAEQEGDRTRQNSLAGTKQDVRRELDSVMGQTA
ncbi:MAG TPA: DNA primase [Thermoleophilaceae bacterium]